MGNASKKLAEKCTILSRDEQPVVAHSFKTVSKNSDKIKEEDLFKMWGSYMDPRLPKFLSNFLFGYGSGKKNIVEFQRFAELYVYCVRGTLDERVMALYNSLGSDFHDDSKLPYELLNEFCESVVATYMMLQKREACSQFAGWSAKGFTVQKKQIQALAEGLLAELNTHPNHVSVEYKSLADWLQHNILLKRIIEQVFKSLYHLVKTPRPVEEECQKTSLVPMPVGLTYMPDYPAIIDLCQLVYVAGHLPTDMQKDWRFLFSSNIHGESFSTLLGRIMNQGPSVIIVEDNNGHIFGGFASNCWSLGPNFTGDDTTFLFTLAPKMRIFPSTGYNNHYQYLNMHQQTMPNGLMMGGQFNFCGLWLDSEYGIGHSSESCTTYKYYTQMSKDKNFHFKNLEVWGVGDKPLSENTGERSEMSILDGNYESKAMLRLVGKEQHSDGLREAPIL